MLPPTFTPPKLNDSRRWEGLRVGLLGGSFNPAHKGHLHIARQAMAHFGLDFVWWLVTPQNPLKGTDGMAPYEERFQSVKIITRAHPRMIATHLEAEMKSRYTYDTVKELKTQFPKTDFLFICGMDNALIFHKWDHWQELTQTVPIVFIARPPAHALVKNCPVRMLKDRQGGAPKGRRTDLKTPRIFWLETSRMMDISSTQIRRARRK